MSDKTVLLILGGARSGKSTYALNQAGLDSATDVLFVATAEARDADMADRISAHRLERPDSWSTVECPIHLTPAIRDAVQQRQSNYEGRDNSATNDPTANIPTNNNTETSNTERSPYLNNTSHDAIRTVIIDCLTLWVSNVMFEIEGSPAEEAEARMNLYFDEFEQFISSSDLNWIFVSNEVGLGLVPMDPISRAYRDMLGRLNQRVARLATSVVFLAAGLPMKLK